MRGGDPTAPVVVVGGGLAGMAAAARLAKIGRPVTLFEPSATLGQRWAPTRRADGLVVDDAPAVLTFPAPWRDLFRKSGRPLEAELSRMGYELVPAGPIVYQFADGSELELPTDRGEQYAVLSAAYGSAVADRWRDLLDRFGGVWQALRPLGVEAELQSRRQLTRPVRRALFSRLSVADLAAELDHPHLSAVIASVAYRAGSRPARTPALVATELAMQRTFGRWTLLPRAGSAGDAGRSSVLVEALAARLALRSVTVHTDAPVEAVRLDEHGVRGVSVAGRPYDAAAVVLTGDPWQATAMLNSGRGIRRVRAGLRRLRPAATATVTHDRDDAVATAVTETVQLTRDGVPTVTYARPHPTGSMVSVHDFGRPRPDPTAGVAWDGFGSWLDRPPVSAGPTGLLFAGPFSPGGGEPSAQVLSGALAAYAADPRAIPR